MKRYLIFDNVLLNGMPEVALILKEGQKTYTVGRHEIEGLMHSTTSLRVDKEKTIAVIQDEVTIRRAMHFFSMMYRQHRKVVKASDAAWADSRTQICDLLKVHQERECND